MEVEYDIYDWELVEKLRVFWVGEEWYELIVMELNVILFFYYFDYLIVKLEWVCYLNLVFGVDVCVGWILEWLEEEGLVDDMIVIFFVDNGWFEFWGIYWCMNSGFNVLFVVSWFKNFLMLEGIEVGLFDIWVVSLFDVMVMMLVMVGLECFLGM